MQIIPIEIVENISSFVTNVFTLFKFKRLCKYLYSKITLEPRQHDNHILILLRLYPKNFFHSRIYIHPDITWNIVIKNPEIKWNYRVLSDNPNITPNIIKKYPQYPWRIREKKKVSDLKNDNKLKQPIFRNKLKQSIGLQDDKFNLSSSTEINWSIVRDYPTIHWNWSKLTINPSISLHDILNNHQYPWNWDKLSYHKELTKGDIIANKPWNWPYLSKRFNIPWNEIHNNNQLNYNDNYLLDNLRSQAILTPEFIESHPEINWFGSKLLSNESLSIDYLLSIIEKIQGFDLSLIIFRSDFKWDLVFKYPNIRWKIEDSDERLLDKFDTIFGNRTKNI